jgi:hypothetical protein
MTSPSYLKALTPPPDMMRLTSASTSFRLTMVVSPGVD